MELLLRCFGLTGLVVAALVFFAKPVLADDGNSVQVLNVGYVREIPGRSVVPFQSDTGGRMVASTVVLVRGPGVVLITDPGMVGDFPAVLEQLKDLGISTGDVTHVFIGRHHPVYAYHVGVFESATLIDFAGIYQNDIWRDHGDNYQIAPGIRVLRTPGYTTEDASLVVETPDGTYAITHTWWYNAQPVETTLAWDQDQLKASRLKLLEIADWIIPGHGALFVNPARADGKRSGRYP